MHVAPGHALINHSDEAYRSRTLNAQLHIIIHRTNRLIILVSCDTWELKCITCVIKIVVLISFLLKLITFLPAYSHSSIDM